MDVRVGDSIQVTGERGWFKVKAVYESDGSFTCWGPLDSTDARFRAFRPALVRKVRRVP